MFVDFLGNTKFIKNVEIIYVVMNLQKSGPHKICTSFKFKAITSTFILV